MEGTGSEAMMQDDNAQAGGAGAPPVIEMRDAPVSIADIGWPDIPALIMFWVLAVVVFLQFFTRYVLNDSLAWTEEVARYVLILVAFLGSVSVVRRGSHIMLEFMFRLLPPVVAKGMAIVAELITFGLFASLTWIGVTLTQKTRQQMVTLPVPKAWIYWVCVACLFVMTIYSALWLWKKLHRTPEEIVAGFDPTETGI